jgi:hypothetical protein
VANRDKVKSMAVKEIVNQRGEATLPLLVGNMNGQRQIIDQKTL